MKKGKVFNIFAGILDIIFAVLMFGLAVLLIMQNEMIFGIALPFFAKTVSWLPDINEGFLLFVLLGILIVFGIWSLVFGIVTLARVGKKQERYYKRAGSLIAYMIIEVLPLAFFTFLFAMYRKLAEFFALMPERHTRMFLIIYVVALSLISLIILFRLIGLIMVFCGRKKFRKAKSEKAVAAPAVQEKIEIKETTEVK